MKKAASGVILRIWCQITDCQLRVCTRRGWSVHTTQGAAVHLHMDKRQVIRCSTRRTLDGTTNEFAYKRLKNWKSINLMNGEISPAAGPLPLLPIQPRSTRSTYSIAHVLFARLSHWRLMTKTPQSRHKSAVSLPPTLQFGQMKWTRVLSFTN